jgi:hypothetical protein
MPNCSVCQQPIGPNQVRVHFDTTGCEGTVPFEPAHLKCYLDVYDPLLLTNAPLTDHIKDRAADALRHGWDHPAMTER